MIGVKPLPEALSMARELGLDLVEVADQANPPVVRIMDYGKYKYEAAQRAKESRKKAGAHELKEMKYRPKIGKADFETKTSKVEKFLAEGHKVKVTIMFRGREIYHPDLGRKILDGVAETVVHVGKVEVASRLDGRNMTMVLAPDKKGKPRKAEDGSERGEELPEPVRAPLPRVQTASTAAAAAAAVAAPADDEADTGVDVEPVADEPAATEPQPEPAT